MVEASRTATRTSEVEVAVEAEEAAVILDLTEVVRLTIPLIHREFLQLVGWLICMTHLTLLIITKLIFLSTVLAMLVMIALLRIT
jgi:hypothetical protein